MKNKKAARKTPEEPQISAYNFRTSVEVADAILANLEKSCAKPEKEPFLDIFPDAGLEPGALTVVCSMPSIGKSSYLVNVALGLVKKGKNVAVFLPDNTPGEFICQATKISAGDFLHNTNLRRGTETLFEAFRKAAGQLPQTGLYLSNRSLMDLADIERDVAHLAAAHKAKGRHLDTVIIDSLNYFKNDEYLEGVSGYLSEAAKRLQVSFICSFDLRPTKLTNEGHVRLADIRAAGMDDRHASLVLFLSRPEYYDRTDPTLKNKACLRVMYSKDTLGLMEYYLDFRRETMRFTSPAYPSLPIANEEEIT